MRLLTLFSILIFTFIAKAEPRSRVTLEGLKFLSNQPAPVQQNEGRLQAEYENRFPFKKNLHLNVHPFLQTSSQPNAWHQPVLVDPRELNLSWESKTIFVNAGYFTLNYEGTDGLNPMDIASMKYWGDPLNPITKASAGVHVGFNWQMFEFEAAYIPEQSPSSLPGEESPWWPRKIRFPLRSENIELRVPDRVDYRILESERVDRALQHNYTSRLQLRTDYGDAAVAFFEGASDTPLVVPTLDVIPISVTPKEIYLLQSPVSLKPIYFRRRTVAGLAAVAWGEWIFRIASRYDQPIGSARRQTTWSSQTVAGVERSFAISDDLVTVILQGSNVESPQSTSLVSLQDLFDQAILLGVRWPATEALTFQVSGLRSQKDKSAYYSAEANYTFLKNWAARLATQLLEGPPESVLGVYEDNDRVSLQVTRSF